MILTSLTALALGAVSLDARMMRSPDVHGDKVVFTYASDLWTCGLNGGVATRLTSFVGQESRAKFSPDGKWIAFTGAIEGNTDVYVMPAEGGEPKRLTYEPTGDLVLDWTPDGRIAYASGNGSHTNRKSRMWYVSPAGGQPEASDVREVQQVSFSPNASTVAINRVNSFGYNWRMYRGGTQGRIAIFDLKSFAYSELPSGREQSWFPMWIGQDIFYISDRNQGTVNLYRYNTASKRSDQLTRFTDGDIKNPGYDKNSILWERNGQVEVFDIASGKVSNFRPTLISDGRVLRPTYRRVGAFVDGMDISPSGRRLALSARGDVYSVPATSGETRNLSASQGSREQNPIWSPDGQSIAYLSDESGERKIYIRPQMGGAAKMIATPDELKLESISYSPKGRHISFYTKDNSAGFVNLESGAVTMVYTDPAQGPSMDWSPDETWIAYSQIQKNLFAAIFAYNVETKKSTKLTEGFYNDSTPVFDLTGKYLYFISARAYNPSNNGIEGASLFQQNVQRVFVLPLQRTTPNPLLPNADEEGAGEGPQGPPTGPPSVETKIDFENVFSRAVALPWPNSNYPFLVGDRGGVYTWSEGALVRFDLASKRPTPVLIGANGFAFNPSRTKIAYQSPAGIGIVDARPGGQAGQGIVNLNDMNMLWDPRAEYKQMFWETWRYQRDTFYDPRMVGLDWKAIGDKYAAMLPSVGDRQDLNYIFGLLIGELGTGHAYITGQGEVEVPTGAPMGMLGVDYAFDGDRIKLAKIYRGDASDASAVGPFGAPGVNVNDGEYLLAINGTPVSRKTNVSQLLVDKVGKAVTLTVSATAAGRGRDVQVRPMGSEVNLRYETWVAERRAMVDKLSGGRIGYMHVPDTSVGGILGFIKGFYSQSGKDAFLIDERYNGGGAIPTFFIEYLQRQFDTALKGRYGDQIGFPTQSLDGPKAMLIDQHAGSGGDMLPWLFKNSGLGPLIGMRTWGGLVGISGGNALVDGGGTSSPGFGIYDVKRGVWIAENTGVDPDIQVDNDLSDMAKGYDRQLERGVDYLMDQLKAGKGRKPFQAPPFPKVKTGGGL